MILQRTFDIDILQPIRPTRISEVMTAGDRNAHRIVLRVAAGDEPADLSGATLHAYVIRADGSTLILPGETGAGEAAFTLSEAAYRVPGRITLLARLSQGAEITTLWWGEASLSPGSTEQVSDPQQAIPSLPALLAQIGALEHAVESARAATESGQALVQQIRHQLDSGAFTGKGLTLLGHYPTADALLTLSDPVPGDAYAVGTDAPFMIHVYDGVTGQFRNHGPLQGAKGDPGLTTSVNGVMHMQGNITLTAQDIPAGNGQTVSQALAAGRVTDIWSGHWRNGRISPTHSPGAFRCFLMRLGMAACIVPRGDNAAPMGAFFRHLWQSPDGSWHVVEQLFLLQCIGEELAMTAGRKYLDGTYIGPADPIEQVAGIR